MATDVWLRKAILGVDQPYHPVGQPNGGFDTGDVDGSVFTNRTPTWAEVLEARADRQAMVRDLGWSWGQAGLGFTLMGAATGVIIRAVIGPGRAHLIGWLVCWRRNLASSTNTGFWRLTAPTTVGTLAS